MPLETVVFLACVFAMFGAFMLSVGGVHLWLALSDRRERTRAPRAVETPVFSAELRRAA